MSELKYLNENNEFSNISRYQVLRVIEETPSTYLETYNQVKIPVSSDDTYHVVSEGEVGRLDMIANDYYGIPEYWWMIAIANNMVDPFLVNEGVMLRIPSLLTVNDYNNKILLR